MRELIFTKMEGAGNDYVYIDALDGNHPGLTSAEIIKISSRRTGIGSDGVVVIAPSEKALAKMEMWNADGSSSAMCGNALRCVGYYVSRKTGRNEFLLESGSGLHETKILSTKEKSAVVEVNLGKPVFEPQNIPFIPRNFGLNEEVLHRLIHIPLPDSIPGADHLHATILSMGNPHCVVFVEDAEKFPVEKLGPVLENHPAFPERTNVEFVSVKPDGTLFQRTYERGSGETLACGSGACAVLVASVLEKKGNKKNFIQLLGGRLEAEWNDENASVLFRGNVNLVFDGVYYFPEV